VVEKPFSRSYAENSNANLINTLESLTGKTIPAEHRLMIVKGASELELVNSGLEDTMIHSYREIRQTLIDKPEIKTLRTAAFVNSIDKIAVSYMNLGVWP
jgi:glutamate dehydrogenase (NAD(P)+)